MQRAKQFADENDGLGLWFPSPSEYDSAAFLAALSERFAEAVEERRQAQTPFLAFLTFGPRAYVFGGLIFAAFGAVYAWSLSRSFPVTAFGAASGLAIGLLYLGLLRALRASRRTGRLLLFARDLKQRVRFSLTRTDGVDVGTALGGHVGANLGLSRRNELAERPVTLSSLIHEFRRLASLAGEALDGPVVIAIDELDKIDDEVKARTLLRDIKGIFGVPGVHFLLSVSYEAARSLNLNGLTERNEFNSSFDVVIEMEPVPVGRLAQLLHNRDWPRGDHGGAGGVAVLAGGVPREAIRLAELVVTECEGKERRVEDLELDQLILAAVSPEAEELRRVIITAGPDQNGSRITQRARVGCFEVLSEDLLSTSGLRHDAPYFAEAFWSPDWGTDTAWSERFLEEWRRLLVRLYVANVLLTRPAVGTDALQRVVFASTQSAVVAMFMLAQTIGLDGSAARFITT